MNLLSFQIQLSTKDLRINQFEVLWKIRFLLLILGSVQFIIRCCNYIFNLFRVTVVSIKPVKSSFQKLTKFWMLAKIGIGLSGGLFCFGASCICILFKRYSNSLISTNNIFNLYQLYKKRLAYRFSSSHVKSSVFFKPSNLDMT